MNIPEDLQQFVGEQLLLGNYDSLDEILIDAVTRFRDKRQAELFEAIEVGRRQIENGECVELKTEAEVDEYFDEIVSRSH